MENARAYLGREGPVIRRRAEEHRGDVDPILCLVRSEQSLCNTQNKPLSRSSQ